MQPWFAQKDPSELEQQLGVTGRGDRLTCSVVGRSTQLRGALDERMQSSLARKICGQRRQRLDREHIPIACRSERTAQLAQPGDDLLEQHAWKSAAEHTQGGAQAPQSNAGLMQIF